VVERRQAGSGTGGDERNEIGVCHLTMSVYPAEVGLGVGHGIRPELAGRVGMKQAQHICCDGDALAYADQEADERALADRAQGDTIDAAYPGGHQLMMFVLLDGECDEHVGVEQVRGHSSSSAVATSPELTRRPTLSTGKPDVGCVRTITGSSSWPSPRAVSSASVADSD